MPSGSPSSKANDHSRNLFCLLNNTHNLKGPYCADLHHYGVPGHISSRNMNICWQSCPIDPALMFGYLVSSQSLLIIPTLPCTCHKSQMFLRNSLHGVIRSTSAIRHCTEFTHRHHIITFRRWPVAVNSTSTASFSSRVDKLVVRFAENASSSFEPCSDNNSSLTATTAVGSNIIIDTSVKNGIHVFHSLSKRFIVFQYIFIIQQRMSITTASFIFLIFICVPVI